MSKRPSAEVDLKKLYQMVQGDMRREQQRQMMGIGGSGGGGING